MMHVNTATNCRSKYTIDAELVLECQRPLEEHDSRYGIKHWAEAFDLRWYWSDREADK